MKNERFYTIIGLVLLISGLAFFTFSATLRQDDTYEKCILFELNEHRINGYDSSRDSAIAHNHEFDVPRPPARNPIDRAELYEACNSILENGENE